MIDYYITAKVNTNPLPTNDIYMNYKTMMILNTCMYMNDKCNISGLYDHIL